MVQAIRKKLSSLGMNGWIVSIQSENETKYLYLGLRARVIAIFLTFTILMWLFVATFMVINSHFLKSQDQVVSLDVLNGDLITLLGERDGLLQENQTLISQTQKALELVYQQEIELNKLKKEIAELNGPQKGDFQNYRNSSLADEPIETARISNDHEFVTTLSKVLTDSTEKLRDSHARVTTLESELAKSHHQVMANNQKMANLLNELTLSISVATSGIKDVLHRVNVSPDKIQNELRALYRNQNQFNLDTLQMETLRSMSSSPVSEEASQVEIALAELNILNLGYQSLPFGDPLKGRLRTTSGYGMRSHPISGQRKMHNGIDFGSPKGTPVYATGNGVVEFVGNKGGFGKTIIIKHISGLRTVYAHLSKINVNSGELVTMDKVIGKVGSTGYSTGPHLHYEITRFKKPLNPLKYMEG